MRVHRGIRNLAISLALSLLLLASTTGASLAVRHRLYVGTITALSSTVVTIHSKTHNADHHFVIAETTLWLRRGVPVTRSSFKVGSYVTVSYSEGPNHTLIAYHISLRR